VSNRRNLVGVGLISFIVTVAGSGPLTANGASVPLVVSIVRHGGLCPSGECRTEVRIFADGTVMATNSEKKSTRQKRKKTWANSIATRLQTPQLNPTGLPKFTGECPTAFDGIEEIFTFPSGVKQRVLASCAVVVPKAAVLSELRKVFDEVETKLR
jgi:hypothetical protein